MRGNERLDAGLSDAELNELSRFLIDRCLPYGGMPISMLDGYLTAIVSCPQVVLPSTWLPAVWESAAQITPDAAGDDGGFAFASIEDAQRYTGLVMRLMNDIARNLGRGVVEPIFVERTGGDGVAEEIASIWCAGYVAGMQTNVDAWRPLTLPDGDDEMLFVPIFELASPLIRSDDDDGDDDEDDVSALSAIPHRVELGGLVPECAERLYRRSREIGRSVTSTIYRPSRPGRNAPCPCGSGRKYKKCCGTA